MSVRREERPAKEFVNRLLSNNFKAMERMGDEVLKPFLQVGLVLCGVAQYGIKDVRWPGGIRGIGVWYDMVCMVCVV